jgi:DNA-binding NarL/FixJ family response regulator
MRRRLAPSPRVLVHAAPVDVARVVRRTLAHHGIDASRPTGPDDGAPAVVVAGATGVKFARQRRCAADAVRRHAPHRVLLVSDLDEPGALRRLLGTGIHGLVLVAELEAALAPAVRAVAAGQLCVAERARAAVVRRPLTAREREVLALVIMGLPNAEIGRRLHLAESTVKTHLASTFSKLGVRSRAEAALVVADPQEMLSTGVLGVLPGTARHDA